MLPGWKSSCKTGYAKHTLKHDASIHVFMILMAKTLCLIMSGSLFCLFLLSHKVGQEHLGKA